VPTEERLRELSCFRLEKRQLQGHLTEARRHLKEGHGEDSQHLHRSHGRRTRDNSHKLKKERF